MAQWGKLSYAQTLCLKSSGKLLHVINTLSEGARIGVAVSGGMDSWVMLQTLVMRQRIVPFKFEIIAFHLNPGFSEKDHEPLQNWIEERNILSHFEMTDFGPRAHSEENRRKSPCFFCAWHRRKRLFNLCQEYKITHLALGHTTDDLISTFLLNLTHTGIVRGLVPEDKYFGGAFSLIRPLLLVEKKYIKQAARQWELPIWKSNCPSSNGTKRKKMEDLFLAICKEHKPAKTSIIRALQRWQMASYESRNTQIDFDELEKL